MNSHEIATAIDHLPFLDCETTGRQNATGILLAEVAHSAMESKDKSEWCNIFEQAVLFHYYSLIIKIRDTVIMSNMCWQF